MVDIYICRLAPRALASSSSIGALQLFGHWMSKPSRLCVVPRGSMLIAPCVEASSDSTVDIILITKTFLRCGVDDLLDPQLNDE